MLQLPRALWLIIRIIVSIIDGYVGSSIIADKNKNPEHNAIPVPLLKLAIHGHVFISYFHGCTLSIYHQAK